MEFNIGELREKRRPLWMSSFDIENFADMLGGGGDITWDRLWPEWQRNYGEELNEQEAQEFSDLHGISSTSEQPQEAQAQSEQPQEAQSESAGLGVGVNVEANVSGVAETVSNVAGTVTDTVEKVGKTVTDTASGLVGGLLGGKKKKTEH